MKQVIFKIRFVVLLRIENKRKLKYGYVVQCRPDKGLFFQLPFLEAESSALKFYVYPVCLFVRLFCTFDRLLTLDLFWILILAGFL